LDALIYGRNNHFKTAINRFRLQLNVIFGFFFAELLFWNLPQGAVSTSTERQREVCADHW
jgi:hypothetical protein